MTLQDSGAVPGFETNLRGVFDVSLQPRLTCFVVLNKRGDIAGVIRVG